MKLLLVGSNGQLGWEILNAAKDCGRQAHHERKIRELWHIPSVLPEVWFDRVPKRHGTGVVQGTQRRVDLATS